MASVVYDLQWSCTFDVLKKCFWVDSFLKWMNKGLVDNPSGDKYMYSLLDPSEKADQFGRQIQKFPAKIYNHYSFQKSNK